MENYVRSRLLKSGRFNIYSSVVIWPPVTIGVGTVVTAGAVVTKDVEAYTVAGEVPAKKIKAIQIING